MDGEILHLNRKFHFFFLTEIEVLLSEQIYTVLENWALRNTTNMLVSFWATYKFMFLMRNRSEIQAAGWKLVTASAILGL